MIWVKLNGVDRHRRLRSDRPKGVAGGRNQTLKRKKWRMLDAELGGRIERSDAHYNFGAADHLFVAGASLGFQCRRAGSRLHGPKRQQASAVQGGGASFAKAVLLTIFSCTRDRVGEFFAVQMVLRSRSALRMTERELTLIAAPAIMGLSRVPVNG